MPSKQFSKALKRDYLNAHNAECRRDRFTEIPRHLWPNEAADLTRLRVWRCRDFLVQEFQESDNVIRLSVTKSKLGQSRQFEDGISWDELQWIKSAVGYGDRMAVEIYPADSNVVNVANMRHLWVLPQPLKIGWNQDDDR